MLRTSFFFGSVGLLLLACGGGVVASADDAAGGSGSGSSSTQTPAAAVASYALDASDVVSVELGSTFCGGYPGKCYDTYVETVDFDAATVTSSGCSSDAGADADPDAVLVATYALAPADADRLRIALAGVRYTNAVSQLEDGQMTVLQITRRSGAVELYSPAAACGQNLYRTLVGGLDNVGDVMKSLL